MFKTKLFSLLLCCLCLSAYGNNKTLAKLIEVNKCWSEQPDISAAALPAYASRTETGWIRLHLMLAEATLRTRDVRHLSPAQQRNRLLCLDNLHTYWQTGNFPVNDAYSYRTPIFIDKYDNFCAVGYLIKASGNEHISRMISAKTNLAYVREMKYPELGTWAAENGFTTDELAWIQPGYPSSVACGRVGNGVYGVINEMYADNTGGKLYVGGNFSLTEGGIAAESIAYVTESGGTYTWHTMGSGVNGTVHAIASYGGKIFVAGSFTMAGGIPANSIASWDGTSWQPAGCVYGTVYDLAVTADGLYAAGDFVGCSSSFGGSFAKWDGTNWVLIPGIDGRVNTLEAQGSSLALGGAFSYGGTPVNAIKWSASSAFQPYAAALANEVMDFEVYGDTLHAVCRHTHATDSANLFVKLRNNAWLPAFPHDGVISAFMRDELPVSINTLCAEPASLSMGGLFFYYPMMGITGHGCYNMGDNGNWMTLDSTVNKMVLFKGELIAAGAFKKGSAGGWGGGGAITLNGIARRLSPSASVPMQPQPINIVARPNPARSAGEITVEAGPGAHQYTIHDMTGRLMASGNLGSARTIALPNMATGIYMLTLTNGAGTKAITRLAIQ